MKIILAENAGFCFGVTKAVEKVYELAKNRNNIYTYGPIIHNESVVADLERKNVKVVNTPDELSKIENGTVVIRSHGVSRSIYEQINAQGLECVDATCPFVKRIHTIVDEESAKGRTIVVIGNPTHPEVEGIVGWTNGPVYVVETPEEAEKFSVPKDTQICLVSQTTYNYNKFKDTVEIFKQKGYNINIVNTICSATEERQTEADRISGQVDAMIVIGGAHSSNTRKLYEICSKKCAYTYFVQKADDLPGDFPDGVKTVGITAGASTPKNIIEEVQTYVRTRSDI
ncbi:MAG: 4-hydroxy-3-methylbut-2-enyl diphosphate reductase [Butyrivibrio sp.]|nr:4-hydroxy-3-methylbut-2-enyl diphosphate reductase [Butyrivibrio sp.]